MRQQCIDRYEDNILAKKAVPVLLKDIESENQYWSVIDLRGTCLLGEGGAETLRILRATPKPTPAGYDWIAGTPGIVEYDFIVTVERFNPITKESISTENLKVTGRSKPGGDVSMGVDWEISRNTD